MDMTLSKRGDYVMKSAIYLARVWTETLGTEGDKESEKADAGLIDETAEGKVSRKIREIVKDTLIPNTFAPQILADLVRAGLVVSKAGRFGGYRLSRDPALISALEVVEAAEGLLRADRCALGEEPCRWDDVCPLHETWVLAGQAVAKVLQETTLAELAARDIAIEEGTYKLVSDAHRSHPVSIDVSDKVQIELNLMKVLKGILTLSGSQESTFLLNDAYEVAVSSSAELLGFVPRSEKVLANGSASFTIDQKPRSVAKRKTSAVEKALGDTSPVEANSEIIFLWKGNSGALIESVEGRISLSPLDNERTELYFEGKLRQARGDRPLSKNPLSDVSAKFVRQFLRRLASYLEVE